MLRMPVVGESAHQPGRQCKGCKAQTNRGQWLGDGRNPVARAAVLRVVHAPLLELLPFHHALRERIDAETFEQFGHGRSQHRVAGHEVDARVARALLVVGLVAAVALGGALLLSFVQSAQLARPLARLARSANRLEVQALTHGENVLLGAAGQRLYESRFTPENAGGRVNLKRCGVAVAVKMLCNFMKDRIVLVVIRRSVGVVHFQ